MATLLQYTPDPGMLLAGSSNVQWTVTVANGTSDPNAAAVDQIVLTVPVGTTAANLVPAFSDISAVSMTNNWTYTLDAGTNAITLAGTPLQQGQSFSLTVTLDSVTDVASNVSIPLEETYGSGLSNSGSFPVSLTSTLLQYTTASTPNPLTEGAANATLVITAKNVTGGANASAVNKIRISIPCGSGAGNLVPSSSDFTVTGVTNGWAQTTAAAVITLTGTALTEGSSFSLTLTLNPVTDQVGTSSVQIQEFYGVGEDNNGSFPITVFTAATVITGPLASPVNIIGTGSSTLIWSVSNLDSGYTVNLVYILNGAILTASNAASGSWDSPTLSTTTIFTLQIFDASQNLAYQSQIAVSVMPPMPVIDTFTGELLWDTAQNCAALTLNWTTTYATYCTISQDGNLRPAQGSATYELGSVKTAAQVYTLTAINVAGSTTSVIFLDWSQASMNQPGNAQVICPQMICSPLTGNVYGISGGSAPVLNVIEFGQTPSYTSITPGGTASCNVVAAAPQASLTSGISDVLYVVVAGDLQQWSVNLSASTISSVSVVNWPPAVTIASTDLACLVGTTGNTMVVVCASAPGVLQIVDVSANALTWSSSVDMTADISNISNLVPLNLLNGVMVANNATTGAVGCALATSTYTPITYPSTPFGLVVSADGTMAWIYNLLAGITPFATGASMPTAGGTPVTVNAGPAGSYLWYLFPTADGSGFIGLYGGANSELLDTVASIVLNSQGLANISPQSCYTSSINWNVQGGACVTNAWPTVVLSTPSGFQVIRTATYSPVAD